MNPSPADPAVNAPATVAQPVLRSGLPTVDNSHATTAPVPAARHHAPPRPEQRLQAQPAPNPAPTAQFEQAVAPPRPGVYSPPAAYSATPYPAAHSQPAATYSQVPPGRPHPSPGSGHGIRPPQPYPAGPRGPLPQSPQSTYRPVEVDPGSIRMTTTTQRPHRRVDTSVLCAAAALILLALAVLVGLML